MRSRLLRLTAALWLLAPLAALASSPDDVAWLWSGGVTPRSAVVKARVAGSAREVRLLLSRGAGFDALVPGVRPARPDDRGIVAFELDGLEPATLYHYALCVDGRRAGEPGRFRTFAEGPMSFRIAFGSCAGTGSEHRIFDTIRELEPLFFLHMGDFHYENIRANDPGAFHRAFDEVLGSRRQAALYRSAPVAYVWDDHDYGPNDADGRSPSRPAALAAYRRVVPHYPLSEENERVETIQQAFSVGRVRFLLSDVRARRDPESRPDGPGKSLLGAAQRAWLLRELERAAGRDALVVWVNPVPWITRSDPGGEHGWEPYAHERALIADRIAALGLADRLVMLSGDAHMVAIDDGTHSNYASGAEPGERGFPVMHAAPLDRYPRSKGGPYSHGVSMHRRLFGLIADQQFGRMEVRDDGAVVEVELSGHDAKGRLLEGTRPMRLRLRCDPGCRVVGE